MTVFLVNRYFHPDHSATSQHFSDLALGLAKAGFRVVAITSRQRIDDPAAELPFRERWGDVEIQRLGGTNFGRGSNAGRLFDYLSFALGARGTLKRLCEPGDAVIAGTDPPLLGCVVASSVIGRKARLFNWLHDLFPEVAQAMGMRGFESFAGRALMRWRNRALSLADTNVVLGSRMYERVSHLGIAKGQLITIHNWADGETLRPVVTSDNKLRQEWGLGSQFVVGYSGNFGVVHEFETVLGAMQELKERDDIRFLFIGAGKRLADLKDAAEERGLCNAMFKPYQPREMLSESLGAADIHLISLRPDLEGLVLPSKLYGIMAAGRPAIHIGDRAGDVAGVLDAARSGTSVAMGDSAALAECITQLADERAEVDAMGRRARAAFDEHYSLSRATAQWIEVIGGAV